MGLKVNNTFRHNKLPFSGINNMKTYKGYLQIKREDWWNKHGWIIPLVFIATFILAGYNF